MWNYVKRLQTTDYILIFLTFVMSLLSLYCVLMPRGLADDFTYQKNGIESAWQISIIFNPNHDSLIVESLKNRLNASEENNQVRELINSLTFDDSLGKTTLAKIVAINGVPWDPSKIKDRNWPDVLRRKPQGYHKERIAFTYGSITYEAILDYKAGNYVVADNIASRLVILWLILYPALTLNTHYRKMFIMIFIIRMIALMVECANAFVLEDLSLIEIYQDFIILADLVLYIPIGKLLHQYNKTLSYILIAMLLLLSFCKISGLRYLPYILSLGYAIHKQKGINKRFFKKHLQNFLAVLAVMFVGTFIHNSLSFFEQTNAGVALNEKIWLVTGYWNFLIMMIGYRMVILTLYFSLMYRVLHLRVEMIERLFTWLIASIFVVLFSNILIDLFIKFRSYINWELPALLLAVVVAIYLNNRLIKLVPLFSPVRFSVRDKGMQILNNSYSFSDPVSYSEYFLGELTKLYPKVKCAIYTESFISGSPFPDFTSAQFEAICSAVSDQVSFVNIDAEILNNTALGDLFCEFDKPHTPHLLFFVRDSAKVVSLLVMGKMSGIYWPSSVAKALNVLVDVYRGFYLGILRQQELIKNSILLDRETEAREFNEKMIKLTTEANERLTEEKMKMVKSIEYASLIQRSILPQESGIATHFCSHFILWQPRDIVGGDFYWMHELPTGEIILAMIDCTGHGVPGALLSMTVNSILHKLIMDMDISQPSEIMFRMHREIGAALHQQSEHTQQDGIDMALIKIDLDSHILVFSGGGMNLLYYSMQDKQLRLIIGDKYGLGGLRWHLEQKYAEQIVPYSQNDRIYLYTDGIIDQKTKWEGREKRLGSKAWLEFIREIADKDLDLQGSLCDNFISDILKDNEQRDDITVMGIQL